MADRVADWHRELARWLEPFLTRLGHKAQRRMCPLYVAGLIGPRERKSVQPMAARLAPGEYDQLHHFVAAGVWDATPLEAELLVQADQLVGGHDAVLVIDDTAMPKKGSHSVGVAAQYASALGKTANCQTLVSTTLARGEVPVMVGLRLFLPESWTSDRARMAVARVPIDRQTFRSKPEIAIEEVDRIRAAGGRFRMRVGRRRLWPERSIPARTQSTRSALGCGRPSPSEGLPGQCSVDLPGCRPWSPATTAHP
jgi:SRSO17 transposase